MHMAAEALAADAFTPSKPSMEEPAGPPPAPERPSEPMPDENAAASKSAPPPEEANDAERSTLLAAQALAKALAPGAQVKEEASVDNSMHMAAEALAADAFTPSKPSMEEPAGPPPAPERPSEPMPHEDAAESKSAPPVEEPAGPPPAPEKPSEPMPDENAAASKSAPPAPLPARDDVDQQEPGDSKSAPSAPPISGDRGDDLEVDGGKSAPPLPDGLPDQDNVAEDEIMPAKSAPPPVGMPKGSEDEGDEEMPAKSAPSSGLDLQKSDTSPRAATPSQEIAALIATAADAELPPSVLSESASFARHFKLMQEKAGLPVVQSPPRSAPPKWRPSPSGKFTERQGSASSAPPQREVMGLLSRMSIRQEIRGEALVVVDPFAQETWKHDRDSLPEESSQPIPVRKVQKQKTWNDSTVASHNFTFDDDEESDEFPEFPEPDEDVDEIAETAEESFVEAQATPQATPARERSRSSSSTEQVFASTSMGSEEQDARDSFASHGERRDRDKLPKIETGLRRSHTAPSGPLAEDDPNIGAHFQDLQKKLRDELAMHEQTRVHAQELERKLKLANAKLTSPPKVKNQHRFGVTAPVPYVAPPLPIRKKEKRGVYLPALKTLKPASPKRDAGDAVLPVVQDLLDTQKMSVMSRQDQSRSRVEAFSRLGQVGMSTWDVRRTEKVSRYQDMTAFSDSMWGSFKEWNGTLNSLE